MRPCRGKTFCCVIFANLPRTQNHESASRLPASFVPFFALSRRLSAVLAGQTPENRRRACRRRPPALSRFVPAIQRNSRVGFVTSANKECAGHGRLFRKVCPSAAPSGVHRDGGPVVEAGQRGAAETTGRQQQQRAITRAGETAPTAPSHAKPVSAGFDSGASRSCWQ